MRDGERVVRLAECYVELAYLKQQMKDSADRARLDYLAARCDRQHGDLSNEPEGGAA